MVFCRMAFLTAESSHQADYVRLEFLQAFTRGEVPHGKSHIDSAHNMSAPGAAAGEGEFCDFAAGGCSAVFTGD